MFQINKYLINKMGWVDYLRGFGPSFPSFVFDDIKYTLFEEDDYVKFFYHKKDDKKLFVIKELSEVEKQKSKKLYKFIRVDYSLNKKPEFEIFEFNSNIEMLKLIIRFEACIEEYARHFKIGKIFRK